MKLLRFINYFIILIAFSFVSFWSAVFYLGNRHTYEILKEDLISNFLVRFLGFWILSLLSALGLYILNWLIKATSRVKMEKNYPLKISKISFIITSFGALLGTIVFFSN